MACDVETIITESCESQIACLSEKQLLIVIAQLLCEINEGGGGGGGGGSGSTCGTSSPEGVVDGSCGKLYYDTNNIAFWVKSTASGTLTGWTQLV